MKKTLIHPRSKCKLLLDSSQIFPDDPGQGTPAIVELDLQSAATYDFAVGNGTVIRDKAGEIHLHPAILDWLESDPVTSEIDKMYAAGPDGSW
jgi:hypothetical protein